MAKGTDLNVAIEAAVHNAIRDMAKTVYDNHGLRLSDVEISWVDVSTVGKPAYLIGEVSARTISNG